MNLSMSIYLDMVRIIAAVMVFTGHAVYERFTGAPPILFQLSDLGNDSVMVFFVLSGFLITYMADVKAKTMRAYSISRLARLYSVALPALVLTVVLDHIGSTINYKLYDGWWYKSDMPVVRFVSSLLFANELWFFTIRPFSNGPYWSLGYEFWYYALFAVYFYVQAKAWKYFLIVMLCLVMGPKILLLIPVWLMGVATYYVTKNKTFSEKTGWILLVCSALGYLAYRIGGGQGYILEFTKIMLGNNLYENLSWSRYFLSSYVIGVFVTLHFIGIAFVSNRIKFLVVAIEKPVRYAASYTFALYLLHYPLLQFFATVMPDIQPKWVRNSVLLLTIIIFVWIIGSFTEKKKPRYKALFDNLFTYCQKGTWRAINRSG